MGVGAVGRETSWARPMVCRRARLTLELQVAGEYFVDSRACPKVDCGDLALGRSIDFNCLHFQASTGGQIAACAESVAACPGEEGVAAGICVERRRNGLSRRC